MIHSIFYSWQSDLPESDNKQYIGTCLQDALAKSKKGYKFSLDYVIDRATSKRIGTIDIAQTIFNKINIAKMFVADVSIINNRTRKYRKMVNPNVLIELGYAVRTIGWENVICVFNTKYGNPEDLPFDIRSRRLLLYNSENNKSVLVNDFSYIIKESVNAHVPSDVIRDFYNAPIYTLLFRIVSDTHKMLFDYGVGITPEDINKTLNLQKEDIANILAHKTLLGFQLFKSYPSVVSELRSQLEKILSIRQFNDIYYVPLVEIIDNLKLHDIALSRRINTDVMELISVNNDEFSIICSSASHDGLPCRFGLVHNIERKLGLGRVVDYGDIIRKEHQEALLHSFKLPERGVFFYSGFLQNLISSINRWIDNNGGEFILDETELEYQKAQYQETDSIQKDI